VSGSVWFQPKQISAVTDSVPEQWRPDCTITNTYLSLAAVMKQAMSPKDALFMPFTFQSVSYSDRVLRSTDTEVC